MPTILIDGTADGAVIYPPAGSTLGKSCFVRVTGLDLSSIAQTIVSLKSGATEIWASEALNTSAGGQANLNVDKQRTLDTAPGQSLVFGNSAGVTIKGSIQIEVYGNPWI